MPAGSADRPRGEGPLRAAYRALRAWSRRRRVVAAVVVVPLTAAYLGLGPGLGNWWAVPVAALSAGLAALIVAGYVPEPGSRVLLDVGCSPCAVMAGATVFGSMVLRDSRPGDAGIALLSLLLLVFGLVQRLDGASTCAAPR